MPQNLLLVSYVNLDVAVLYTIVVVSFVLSTLAVVFAYRLSRITGLFNAWAMLIGGLALTAFEDFAYFGSVIFASYSKVASIVEGYTPGTFVFAGLILIGIPVLFCCSMYRLHSIFKAQTLAKSGRMIRRSPNG